MIETGVGKTWLFGVLESGLPRAFLDDCWMAVLLLLVIL
jgi:hypothetical protein